jgi:hypothetical protein
MVELSSRGFRFLDLSRSGFFRGKRIHADAIFLRRPSDRDKLLKAALVLMELGYFVDSAWMMREAELDDTEIRLLQNAARAARSQRIRKWTRLDWYKHKRSFDKRIRKVTAALRGSWSNLL